jgi:hypothetical protein
MPLNGPKRVLGTTWREAAIRAEQRTQQVPVPANHENEDGPHYRAPKRLSTSARNAAVSRIAIGLRTRTMLSMDANPALWLRKTSRITRLTRLRSTDLATNRLPTMMPSRVPDPDSWRKTWKCALTAAGLNRSARENSTGMESRCARRKVNRGDAVRVTR